MKTSSEFRKIRFACPACGANVVSDHGTVGEIVECGKCHAAIEVPRDSRPFSPFVLSTAGDVAGHRIVEHRGLVGSTVIEGVGPAGDLTAWLRDGFGGRAKTLEGIFDGMRSTILNELRQKALAVGANAVIAIRIDHEVLKDGGMLMAAGTGTAVRIEAVGTSMDDTASLKGKPEIPAGDVACPHCNAPLIADVLVRGSNTCPHCGEAFEVS